MRTALLLLGLCAVVFAKKVLIEEPLPKYRVADPVFLQNQKDLLRLFRHVFQPNFNMDQVELGQSYKIEDHLIDYANQKAVKEFLFYSKEGFLPRGELFSIFNNEHRQQAETLFRVFYYAKNWQALYQAACWARDNVNEGVFVYALQAAVLHRHDTQGMVLPPIYEINPYFFVNSEVIDRAYEYKMRYGGNNETDVPQKYYIEANYSGWYQNLNSEQTDLSYFMEDVGLNAYYYYFHLDYPFWLGGKEFGLNKDRRGELYYYVHQQILARFYLERLSNGYGNIHFFDWDEPIQTGYLPHMRYPNGLEYPTRPANADNAHAHFTVQQIEDYERRIRDAIDLGYIYTELGMKVSLYDKQGFDLLGQIIESNPDSPNCRYYGYLQVFAHQVLGYSSGYTDQFTVHPSALEHFETALRDPVFYQFYKRITYYFLKYKSNLPSYTYMELNYPGVVVDSVETDKLVTYLDQFDWELTNALYVNQEEYEKDYLQVWARQYRLNHRPFTYRINLQSSKPQNVVVRVFLGPKYDDQGQEISLNKNRVNFVELDKFVYTLNLGKNIIERNFSDSDTVRDRTSYRDLYQHVTAALQGEELFRLDMSEAHNGFPNRLALPRGTEDGQAYQLYVYVGPHKVSHVKPTFDSVISAGVGSGARYVDDYPFGYPLDRQIRYENYFNVPNSYFQDVVIYHDNDVMQIQEN